MHPGVAADISIRPPSRSMSCATVGPTSRGRPRRPAQRHRRRHRSRGLSWQRESWIPARSSCSDGSRQPTPCPPNPSSPRSPSPSSPSDHSWPPQTPNDPHGRLTSNRRRPTSIRLRRAGGTQLRTSRGIPSSRRTQAGNTRLRRNDRGRRHCERAPSAHLQPGRLCGHPRARRRPASRTASLAYDPAQVTRQRRRATRRARGGTSR